MGKKSEIEELEAEKLRLEIKEKNNIWLKVLKYLRVLLPSFIALGSVLFAFQSDLISIQREKNELRAMQIRDTIARFELHKRALMDTLNIIESTNDSLIRRTKYIKEYYNSEIMTKAYESSNLLDKIVDTKYRIDELKFILHRMKYNIKILKNAPLITSSKEVLLNWEEKNMKIYMDSTLSKRSGNLLGTKKLLKKFGHRDSIVKEYSSIKLNKN